jgi:hypothetical protein
VAVKARLAAAVTLYAVGCVLVARAAHLPVVTWGWLDGATTANGLAAASMALTFGFSSTNAAALVLVAASPVILWLRLKGRGGWIRWLALVVAGDVWPWRASSWQLEPGYGVWAAGVSAIVAAMLVTPSLATRSATDAGAATGEPMATCGGGIVILLVPVPSDPES